MNNYLLSNTDKSAREQIARVISTSVPIATGFLGICGIAMGIFYITEDKSDKANQTLQYVFTALLPIFGTWMGTVMAYYFSKENFEAANRSVEKLVTKMTSHDKLKKVLVKDVMIPFENFRASSRIESTEIGIDVLLVKDLIKKMNDDERQRLPILLNNQVKYIFHKSTLLEYLYENLNATQNVSDTSKIADMKNSKNQRIKNIMVNGVKYLKADANLLDAKLLMESETACNDVIITDDGTQAGAVKGWITDKIINKESQV